MRNVRALFATLSALWDQAMTCSPQGLAVVALVGSVMGCSTSADVGDETSSASAISGNQRVPQSSSPSAPTTAGSPPEYIDSLDYVAPCRDAGCSVAHTDETGQTNIHWWVGSRTADRGTAYHVKGTDPRCWERLEWNADAIAIPYDNCWWTPGYQYSRYKDGRWLARIWKPGDAIEVDHTVYGGRWDACTDTAMGQGQTRVMTFVWRVKDYDWGPAGKLDTIAVRQSYPWEPRAREYYFYAKGYGLIGWSLENDAAPSENKAFAFNLGSTRRPIPVGTACVSVETPTPPAPTPPASTPPASPPPASTPPASDGQAAPSAPAPTPTCTLRPGYVFSVGTAVYSCNRRYALVLQSDGNLVLYDVPVGVPLWWSLASGGTRATSASFQTDGNLVARSGSAPVFASNTGGMGADQLAIQDDGNVVIYRGSTPLWSTR